MAMAGQMVKRSVTRCERCCEGSSPGTQFGVKRVISLLLLGRG